MTTSNLMADPAATEWPLWRWFSAEPIVCRGWNFSRGGRRWTNWTYVVIPSGCHDETP